MGREMEGLQPCVSLQIVNTLCPGWEVAWEPPRKLAAHKPRPVLQDNP